MAFSSVRPRLFARAPLAIGGDDQLGDGAPSVGAAVYESGGLNLMDGEFPPPLFYGPDTDDG